jgi:acetyl esterase/lipase
LLRSAGVPVEYQQYDGMNHGFIGNLDLTPSSPAALDYMAAKIVAATSTATATQSAPATL